MVRRRRAQWKRTGVTVWAASLNPSQKLLTVRDPQVGGDRGPEGDYPRWYTLGPGWPSQTRNVARVYLRSRVFVKGSVREETAALCIGLRSPAKPCQETRSVLGGTAMR